MKPPIREDMGTNMADPRQNAPVPPQGENKGMAQAMGGSGMESGGMQDAPGGPQQASPEEQELYNQFVAKAMELTYDPKFMPKVVAMLEGEGDPQEGLAKAAALIIARVATSAEKAGIKLTGDVLFHAGTEVFEDLAELSKEAGIKDYSQDPDALEGAYFRTLDQFRVMMQESGRLNPQTAQKEMAMLEQMDANGELERMLRGLAEQDEKRMSGGKSMKPEKKMRGLMPEGA